MVSPKKRKRRLWTHLGVERAVQQHVAGLQVHVQQSRRQAVQEVDAQAHLVSQSADQRPGRGFV